ncbi:MAG: GTP-binding protein [Bacillota bacterium]|jgi:G3E family GTPase
MKIDVISGFLGAGKTTFLNKILPYLSGNTVIIENEYGDIAVDGSLVEDDLPVKEIMAGCICCSLVMDFQKAIKELSAKYHPERIIIEPSGVSCLSDVVKACERVKDEVQGGLEIDRLITIVDITAFEEYIENFGVFYGNQIENANTIFFSHLNNLEQSDLDNVLSKIREINSSAAVWHQDWYRQDGMILAEWLKGLSDNQESVAAPDLKRVIFNAHDVFGSWSAVNEKTWTKTDLENLFAALKSGEYGRILRAKGILKAENGSAVNFNFTPFNQEYHHVKSAQSGKVAVIGCQLDGDKLTGLFA